MQDDTKPNAIVVREQYDWATISPASAVVETVSQALDCGPTAFGPLYEYIDPDALNNIVASTTPSGTTAETVVSFQFDAHTIAVHGSGDVVMETNAAVDA